MKIHRTELPGVCLFEPRVFGDERGFFLETFRASILKEFGIDEIFVQHNHSRSRRGVLRGLHFQREQPQGKLVRAVRGSIFDVAAEIRPEQPAFGHWVGVELNDINHRQLYIPPGYAHGFLVLSEVADVEYKCTDYYHGPSEAGVAWDDPILDICWPLEKVGGEVVLSAKDRGNPRLGER